MAKQPTEELNNAKRFSFFPEPTDQELISIASYENLKANFFMAEEDVKLWTMHELWRIGRLDMIYAFLVDPTIKKQEEGLTDLISTDELFAMANEMIRYGNVPFEEVSIFLHDLYSISANVCDHQDLGEKPLYPERVEKTVNALMVGIVSSYEEFENLSKD
jgi:hypothetical protein